MHIILRDLMRDRGLLKRSSSIRMVGGGLRMGSPFLVFWILNVRPNPPMNRVTNIFSSEQTVRVRNVMESVNPLWYPGSRISRIRIIPASTCFLMCISVIYTTTDWWTTCTGNTNIFASTNPLFIARYSSSIGTLPSGWSFTTFWQFADSGTFPGDQDVFNGSADGLKK